jgi:hypothetical protein
VLAFALVCAVTFGARADEAAEADAKLVAQLREASALRDKGDYGGAAKKLAKLEDSELGPALGLARTRYDSNTELIKNRARGYSGKDGKLVNADFLGMSQPGAAGALLSTGGDLVRWSMALSSEPSVPPDRTVRSRYQWMTPARRRFRSLCQLRRVPMYPQPCRDRVQCRSA